MSDDVDDNATHLARPLVQHFKLKFRTVLKEVDLPIYLAHLRMMREWISEEINTVRSNMNECNGK